ncbi:MAG TPA: hypothetical protein DCY13_05530 [Verrucomicrobiales bacterium]|nr:hypothetical protein [Verrucomicrobiales bacterium]
MNVSLYQAAAAMNATARWQDVISSNLAASSIPGFKKDEISFAAIEAGMMPVEGAQGRGRFQMPMASGTVNFQQGEMQITGVNTDLAISGPGFFEVQLPDGRLAYTRDGQFNINNQGQLATKDGGLVMGENGPFVVDLNNPAELEFSTSGEASQGVDRKGRLRVVNFDQPQQLLRLGNYFLPENGETRPEPVANVSIQPRSLERSNTSPMIEMTHLLTAMRLFESNNKLMQMQDQHMERLVRDLTPNQ